MSERWAARIALVTGAGQGVGRAAALALAARGDSAVVVNDLDPEKAEAVAAEVEAAGAIARVAVFDVADFGAAADALDDCHATLGSVDILVNNAGNAGAHQLSEQFAPFAETEPADWDRWLRPNLYGVMNCTRLVLPGMIDHKWGRVVTVVSDAGRVGEPRLAAYSAAKAGAAGLMRAVAKEVGRFGVTANCVALGTIRTPATQTMLDDGELVRRMTRHYPVPRLGEPEDAARVIAFLASDAGAWITAQTYPVNGGYAVSV